MAEPQWNRAQCIRQCFKQLHEDKFAIQNILSLKVKHLTHLFQRWENEGLSQGTINGRRSKLAVFTRAIGKAGMVPEVKNLGRIGIHPSIATRSSVARVDKSWSEAEFEELCKAAHARDVRYGLIIEVCWHFGLRGMEAVMLEPRLADGSGVLKVVNGTKGGKYREIAIETDAQSELLERCKVVAITKNESLSGRARNKKQAMNWYKLCNLKVGATKLGKFGKTPHGLRHSYAHAGFLAGGVPVPVKGEAGVPNLTEPPDQEEMNRVEKKVSMHLGHVRVGVTSAYCGSRRRKKRRPKG